MISGTNSLDKFYRILDWIYPAYFLVYFVEFYTGMWRLSTLLKFACILLTFFYCASIIGKAKKSCRFFQLFGLYFLYCVFSIVWYAVNGIPIDCYLNELYNSLPAMFFVFVGLADDRKDRKFYERFAYSCTLMMLLGLFFYVTTPGWFVQRSMEAYERSPFHGTISEDTLLSSMRFSGFFRDVYEADMYAMVALSISLFMFFRNPKSKGEIWIFLMVIINLVAAILTQQRVAMASSVFTFLFYVVYCGVKGKSRKSRIMIIGTLLLIAGMFSFVMIKAGDRLDQLSLLLGDRLENMSISEAYSERSNQHETIMEHFDMPLFGKGAGSGSTAAAYHGLPHINDGGYWQVLYEFGIVGFLTFLFIMFRTVLRAVKIMRYYLIELVIVSFVLVAMLGSNTLTIGYMLIVPFWYSIGRIWNRSLRKQYLQENIIIK